jgi:hypothetical protein
MHDDYKASLADWIAILSISTRLIFEKVRQRAIKEITIRLDEIEPFQLISLAIKYDVQQWLKPAYRRIVMRAGLITHAEALQVPFPMAVMLMRSREQYWKNYNNNPQMYSAHLSSNLPRGSPDPIIDAEVKLMELASRESSNTAATTATMHGRAL